MNSVGHSEMHGTFGTILAGHIVGCVIYGITAHQTYRFFRLYPHDSRGMKLLILALLTLDTLHLIESSHMCYYYLIQNYSHPKSLLSGTWSVRLLSPTMACIL
ncbi:hypothetical protein V8D89_012738 [Ganoderma adspersum]